VFQSTPPRGGRRSRYP